MIYDNNYIHLFMTKHNLGQYFTTHNELKEKVFEFILNDPKIILEPCIGQGDLIKFIICKNPTVIFDMYEIDININLLDGVDKDKVIYGDFMTKHNLGQYKTIIGNPPYVRTSKGNLYIDFIEKCYKLLEDKGELIFIVPSDFFKLTSASKLLNDMMMNGSFTHVFHPNNDRMFDSACIDIIIFRYCKKLIQNTVLYNNKRLYIINNNGLITFNKQESVDNVMFQDYFDIYVGLVSAKEDVYKNKELGNIEVINGLDKIEKYIFIEKYPCENNEINTYLIKHKNQLISRGIRKFNEKNWFEWGAPRNINTIRRNAGKDCIYIYNLTRKTEVSFVSKVSYFSGGLLMLIPKQNYNLSSIVSYINSNEFKDNFMFSGRFKIGHRQVCNSFIPTKYL